MKAPVFMISGFSDCCINLYWGSCPVQRLAAILSPSLRLDFSFPQETGTLRRATPSEDTIVIRILFLYMRFDIRY